jgi:SAM-dependent methyltransferase
MDHWRQPFDQWWPLHGLVKPRLAHGSTLWSVATRFRTPKNGTRNLVRTMKHANSTSKKIYDQRYFDRWYRTPRQRVGLRSLLERKVALALAVAEYHLGHPVRSVLDIGCGEGAWRSPLLQLRPHLHYMGVDASEYAVHRHGTRRNLKLASFAQLAELRFGPAVDLLICSDVLHYLKTPELKRGLTGFAELCNGVAFVEVFARGDDFVGDTIGYIARPATRYRRLLREAGFSACGSHCYLSQRLAESASALELC